MVLALFTKIAAMDAEGIDTLERVHSFGSHMLFISHHHKVVARYRSIDDKDLKLFIIRVIGIEAFALVLTTA